MLVFIIQNSARPLILTKTKERHAPGAFVKTERFVKGRVSALAAMGTFTEIAIHADRCWVGVFKVIILRIGQTRCIGDVTAQPNGELLRGGIIGAV